MAKKKGGKAAIVTSKELGTNCWLPIRFIEGSRCQRVMECTYPEKKTCKAVYAEIAYLRKTKEEAEAYFHTKINKLLAEQRR